MDWMSLVMLGPPSVAGSLLLVRWLRERDRLPDSISTPILFGLIFSVALSALVFAHAAWITTVTPLRAQQDLLGRVVAGPRSLVEMQQRLVQPTSTAAFTRWTYRLSAAEAASLSRRCHDPFLTGDCRLGRREQRFWATSASLTADRLVIESGPVE